MAAYVIFDVEDIDPGDEYVKLAGESLAPFQSKAIVHGGMVEVSGGRLGTQGVGNAGI